MRVKILRSRQTFTQNYTRMMKNYFPNIFLKAYKNFRALHIPKRKNQTIREPDFYFIFNDILSKVPSLSNNNYFNNV